MSKIVRYEHHGVNVAVREDLKGRHWEHCLCHSCAKLNLQDRQSSCPIANALYALCVLTGCTTPVFECPKYEEPI